MDDAVLFHNVAEAFNKIRRASNAKTKGAMFNRALKEWKKVAGEDVNIFCVVRLFLPTADKRQFDMKEKKLASFLAKVFLDDRKDYLRTLSKSTASDAARILAETVSENRSEDDASEVLTVREVNQLLDLLTSEEANETNRKLKTMEKLVRSCSEDELEWIFNIIMKNTESALGVSMNNVLDWISPDARNKWSVESSSVSKESPENDEHLFVMWKPMLLSRQKRGNWYENIEKYGGAKFFMQTKFDGENVLLHKRGGEYRWFSRNGKDFSREYGNRSTASDTLAQRIHPFFADDLKSAIFNCEIMLWDKVNKNLCRHNDASKTSDNSIVSFRHIKKSDNQQLTCVIFDLLYYNGTPLFAAPLDQRIEMLNVAVLKRQRADSIFIAENVEGESKKDIMDFFQKAMHDNEEGIVVKRRDSLYKKGERNISNGWFKLKPSASEDCDLDLALVSIHPGEGLYGRPLFRFAARDQDAKNRFTMCLGVSNGLRDEEREMIIFSCGELTPDPPEELRTARGFKPFKVPVGRGGYVDPEKWPVITIRSNGVRNGKLVDAAMTRIRDDKSLDEINTIQDFREYESKVSDFRLNDVDKKDEEKEEESPRKKARLTRKAIEAEHLSPVKPKNVVSDVNLRGVQIAVLQGTSEKIRRQCEEVLAGFGAIIVKNPTNETQLVVATAPKETYPTTAKAIATDKWTVIKASWALRCKELQFVVPWERSEVFKEQEDSFRIR
ncbi:unnamed protein product [Caenorhabditis auriculariae]|uniref:DNA ligase IV n=1 Tax=Caenorhabditis auriculariae TaxID=2777116 RepID=A0A8S1GYH0_9PELO|nr:unnamed protein product [Caenorhabditis auriculariae]